MILVLSLMVMANSALLGAYFEKLAAMAQWECWHEPERLQITYHCAIRATDQSAAMGPAHF